MPTFIELLPRYRLIRDLQKIAFVQVQLNGRWVYIELFPSGEKQEKKLKWMTQPIRKFVTMCKQILYQQSLYKKGRISIENCIQPALKELEKYTLHRIEIIMTLNWNISACRKIETSIQRATKIPPTWGISYMTSPLPLRSYYYVRGLFAASSIKEIVKREWKLTPDSRNKFVSSIVESNV